MSLGFVLRKLALNDGKKDHVGEKTQQSRGEHCAHFPSLSARWTLTEGDSSRKDERAQGFVAQPAGRGSSPSVSVWDPELEPAGFWPAEEAKHAIVMEHRSQLPTKWRALRSLMDAEVDLEALGLVDAAQHARLAREKLEESGLEAA